MATSKDSPETQSGIKVPPGALTTPCTVLALHNWLLSVHATAPGWGSSGQVTTTTTSIAVA
jgi:hypothetical protein